MKELVHNKGEGETVEELRNRISNAEEIIRQISHFWPPKSILLTCMELLNNARNFFLSFLHETVYAIFLSCAFYYRLIPTYIKHAYSANQTLKFVFWNYSYQK
jgi:hypothetical protein